MNKTQEMIIVLATIVGFSLGAVAGQSEWTWTVPAGVDKIKVKSHRNGETIMNYTFAVEPGQTFKLEVVN